MNVRNLIDKDKIKIAKITLKYKYRTNNNEIINDDVIYCGELNDQNKPHGYGTGIFNKFKYCGLWINGEPNGKV